MSNVRTRADAAPSTGFFRTTRCLHTASAAAACCFLAVDHLVVDVHDAMLHTQRHNSDTSFTRQPRIVGAETADIGACHRHRVTNWPGRAIEMLTLVPCAPERLVHCDRFSVLDSEVRFVQLFPPAVEHHQ